MILKEWFILAFSFTFCLENKGVCKGEFVFVMITESFRRIFWLDNWQSLIVFLENFHYSEINLYLDLTGRNGQEVTSVS